MEWRLPLHRHEDRTASMQPASPWESAVRGHSVHLLCGCEACNVRPPHAAAALQHFPHYSVAQPGLLLPCCCATPNGWHRRRCCCRRVRGCRATSTIFSMHFQFHFGHAKRAGRLCDWQGWWQISCAPRCCAGCLPAGWLTAAGCCVGAGRACRSAVHPSAFVLAGMLMGGAVDRRSLSS